HPGDRLGRRRSAGHDDPGAVAAGDLALPARRRVEHGRDDRGRGAPTPHARAVATAAAPHAGAAHITVTPYFSTRLRISVPSTLRSATWGTPQPVIANGIPQPLAWNIGRVCR